MTHQKQRKAIEMDHIIAIVTFLFHFALNILPYSILFGVGAVAGYMFGFNDGWDHASSTNIDVP